MKLNFFAKLFKGTFRILFLGYIDQAEAQSKERIFSDSDEPALRDAKDESVSVAFNALRAIVNEKMG